MLHAPFLVVDSAQASHATASFGGGSHIQDGFGSDHFGGSLDPAALFIPAAIRAQRSPFLSNHQGLEYGLPIRLVNSSRGNLTFQWRDLTLPGHIPFVVGRVYDSDLTQTSESAHPACSEDFGRGWRMLPSDHILMLAEGNRLELHGTNGLTYSYVLDSSGTFVPEKDRPDIVWERIILADGVLEARRRGGEVQTYQPGEEPGLFLLVERRDANGHWLRFDWQSDRLLRIENDGGAHVEVVREVLPQAARETAQRVPGDTPIVAPGESGTGPLRITTLRDSTGRTVAFRYDGASRLVASIAYGGVLTRWTYDDGGRLAGATDAAGRSLVTAVYGKRGRLIDLVIGGGRLTFEYDSATDVTHVRNATGSRWQMNHDPQGRVVRVIDPMGLEQAFAYGESGDLVEHRDTQGKATRYEYSRHLVTRVDRSDGSSVAYEYDSEGRLLAFTDQRGAVTRFTYDERGNLLGVTDGPRQTHSSAYDDAGNAIELIDPLDRRSGFAYDAFGRATEVIEPGGERWLLEYDLRGPITRISGPHGESLTLEYDAAGPTDGSVLSVMTTPTILPIPSGYSEPDLDQVRVHLKH